MAVGSRGAWPVEPIAEVAEELDRRVEALGFELVEADWGGTPRRPILRIRVDLPASEPGQGVTVGDCARASRALEEWLDGHAAVPERYVLEVSSPGVERPLTRERDFRRFVGREVRLRTSGRKKAPTVEGVLESVREGEVGKGFEIAVRLSGGGLVWVQDREIVRANLVYHWGRGEE
jgi:ribosome maturation factor RimP